MKLILISIIIASLSSCVDRHTVNINPKIRGDVEKLYGVGLRSFPKINEYTYYNKDTKQTIVYEYQMTNIKPNFNDKIKNSKILPFRTVDSLLEIPIAKKLKFELLLDYETNDFTAIKTG